MGQQLLGTMVTIKCHRHYCSQRSTLSRWLERKHFSLFSLINADVNIAGDFGSFWSYAQRLGYFPFTKWASPRLSLLPNASETLVLRPLVQVQCKPPVDITDVDDDEFDVKFPANLLKPRSGQRPFNNVTAAVNSSHYRLRHTVVNFQDLSAEAGTSMLGAVAGMWFYHAGSVLEGYNESESAFGIIPCTISAHWILTNLSMDPNTQNVVSMDNLNPLTTLNSSWFASHAQQIDNDLTYTEHVNIPINTGTGEQNVLNYELKGSSTYGGYDGGWQWRWSWEVATIISLQLSDSLAHIRWGKTPLMVFCEGCSKNVTYGTSYVQDLGAQNTTLLARHIPTTLSRNGVQRS